LEEKEASHLCGLLEEKLIAREQTQKLPMEGTDARTEKSLHFENQGKALILCVSKWGRRLVNCRKRPCFNKKGLDIIYERIRSACETLKR